MIHINTDIYWPVYLISHPRKMKKIKIILSTKKLTGY